MKSIKIMIIRCHFFLMGLYSLFGISWPIFSHKLSLSLYPSTGYTFSSGLFYRILSSVSLKVSLIMRGISCWRRGEEHSRQGFSLTSISHTFSSESMIKSRPKSSKQCLRWLLLIFFLTELKAIYVISFIRLHTFEVSSSPMNSFNLLKDSWFPF